MRPRLRLVKLKRPFGAHFTIRDLRQSISGRDVSKGDPHLVRRLTLPSNQTAKIEIGLKPRIAVHVAQIVLSCGKSDDAPEIQKRIYQYVKSGARPSTKKDWEADGSYHAIVDKTYNIGTHYVMGVQMRTRAPGLYPVSLEFITNEIEGAYESLEILVEDSPSTSMLCHAKNHGRNCLVKPVPDRPANSAKPRRQRPENMVKCADRKVSPPQVLEAAWRQFGVSDRALDRAMA